MSNHKARKKSSQSEMDTYIPANLRDIRTSFLESLRRRTKQRFRDPVRLQRRLPMAGLLKIYLDFFFFVFYHTCGLAGFFTQVISESLKNRRWCRYIVSIADHTQVSTVKLEPRPLGLARAAFIYRLCRQTIT